MNMKQAVQSVYKNYFNFKGRSNRSEFWYFALFTILIQIVLGILAYFLPESVGKLLSIVSGLFSLFNFIPAYAVWFRRIHDVGKSAWNILWLFLPILGAIYLLVLACMPSDGPNKWGNEPLSPNQF